MDRRFLDIAIKQLDWERYRRGYGNDAEVVTLKYRLREIDKNGHPVELTESEVAILQNSTKHSIRHILNYDYQLPNAEELRDEALNPLYEFILELNTQEATNESQS